jgi:hypothetical protein
MHSAVSPLTGVTCLQQSCEKFQRNIREKGNKATPWKQEQ